MSKSNSVNGGGTGVFGLLGVVFVVLKLTHVIDWSWWYVTLPFWGWIPVMLIVLAVCVFIVALEGKGKK